MKKIRVQFDFNQDALERLDSLVEATGSSTRAEVIRKSLSLLDKFIELTKNDEKILIESKNKQTELALVI